MVDINTLTGKTISQVNELTIQDPASRVVSSDPKKPALKICFTDGTSIVLTAMQQSRGYFQTPQTYIVPVA